MSDEERSEGARLIEERIRDTFSSAGKTVAGIKWNLDRGGQLLNYSSHTIHVTVDGEELRLESVPNERIVDYPGGVGNETLDAHIRQLAQRTEKK